MVKPLFLAVIVFWHYTDGLALLDFVTAYDADGADILICPFDITGFVLCFLD